MVKHTNSLRSGCEFESCTCRNKNAIGKEGSGQPPHKVHIPRKNSDPYLRFLLRSKSSLPRSIALVIDLDEIDLDFASCLFIPLKI